MTPRVLLAALALTMTVTAPAPSFAGIVLEPLCGDVNASSSVNSSDALLVLRKGVGQSVTLKCGDCPAVGRYGVFGDQPIDSEFSPGYLLGHRIEIETSSTITHLGVFTKSGGPNVRMALYTDNAGQPDHLLVESAPHALVAGFQELPVAATPVSAGTYWMMGLYDDTARIAIDDDFSTQAIRYRGHPFADPLPDPFGVVNAYTGATFSYWIKVLE